MKAIFTLLFCSSFLISTAQYSILFVDDSDDEFDNSLVFQDAIAAAGYSAPVYNVPDSSSGPSVQFLADFDLVIWHTSSSGFDLELWDQTDQDNENIKGYLDGGGKLWLVGLDFLFDRYSTPPATFLEGDFVYDYLGLSSYDVQSYGDDGSLGVPEVYPDMNAPIENLNTLTWIFDTSWWVDGVTPTENAEVVYRMGNEDYIFAEKPAAIFHESDDFKTLTYFFDLAQVANEEMLNATVFSVLQYFDGLISGVSEYDSPINDFTIYPNPAVSDLTVSFSLNEASTVTAEIVDLQGKLLAQLQSSLVLPEGENSIQLSIPQYIPSGAYFLKLNAGDRSAYKKLIIGGL